MRIVIVTLALLAAACELSPPSGEPASLALSPPADLLLLATSREELDTPATAFKLFALRDLWFRVRVPSLSSKGASVVELSFTSPQGEVFYQDHFSFARVAASNLGERSTARIGDPTLPRHDPPVTVHAATSKRGRFHLEHFVPIGGSVFQRYPLKGSWTLQAKVDNNPQPLTTTFQFN
jgi:hypothetical protein